jgi:hypothetical protein
MKTITKYLMILLSYSPIVTIAVAAQAKASEIEGEGQNEVLMKELRSARTRILPDGHTGASIEQVITRYGAITGLEGENLKTSLSRDLQILIDQGIIHANEKEVLSSGPSQYQMH